MTNPSIRPSLLILALGATLAVSACGTSASDAPDTALAAESGTTTTEPAARQAAVKPAAAPRPTYREVTLPAGTTLPLSLTSSMASDTSAVEDRVSAELTRAVVSDGREVLKAGDRLQGFVTAVDDAGHVKGRASIAFRFTSIESGGEQYDVETEAISHLAPATKGEDATRSASARAPARSSAACSAGKTARPRARPSAAPAAPASCSRRAGKKCASDRAPT